MSPSELVVLGTAMAYPGRAAEVLGDLEAADMLSPHHGAVLTVIRALVDQGQAAEPPLIVAGLERLHGIRPVIGRPWPVVVYGCLRMATIPEGCAPHRRAVLEARLRLQARGWGEGLTAWADGPLDELNYGLQTAVTALGRTLARIAEQTPATEAPAVAAIRPISDRRRAA